MLRKSNLLVLLIGLTSTTFSQVYSKQTKISFGMPHPSGKYGISRRKFIVTDSSRPDSVLKTNGRSIPFQIWFPSIVNSYGKVRYIPDATIDGMIQDKYNNIDSLTIRKWATYFVSGSISSAIVRSKRFPILFFLHGFGVSQYNYTSIIQEIASQGFVVVSLDSPHSGLLVLPNGKLVNTLYDGNPVEKCEAMATDVSFIMDFLQKGNNEFLRNLRPSINFKKAGVLGHSLGGAAALETCRIDPRFVACADLDGDPLGKVEQNGVNRPTLVLLNEPRYMPDRFNTPGSKAKWDSMGNERKAAWLNICNLNRKVPFYAIRILGTNHFSFTDFPFLTIKYFENENAGVIINRKKGLRIISAYITRFFKKQLKIEEHFTIDALTAKFPETSFLF